MTAAAFQREIDDVVKRAMTGNDKEKLKDLRREAKRLKSTAFRVKLKRTDAMDQLRRKAQNEENQAVEISYEIIGVDDVQCRPVIVTPRNRQARPLGIWHASPDCCAVVMLGSTAKYVKYGVC